MNSVTSQRGGESTESMDSSVSKKKGVVVSKACWVFLVLALALVVVGALLPGPSVSPNEGEAVSVNDLGFGNSLVGPGENGIGGGDSGGVDQTVWGPALLRGGFSAFLGLAVGVALRSFFRAALVFLGMFFGGLMMFEYWGFVTVEWERIDASFRELVSSMELRVESFPFQRRTEKRTKRHPNSQSQKCAKPAA